MNTELLTIKIENIFKKYKKNIVFNKFNLELDASKINLFIGYNGCGKSTLFKMILKLINYKGKITTNCQIKSYCPDKVILPEYIKVYDFLKLFDLDFKKVDYLIDKFQLDLNKQIKELSKGMRQKLLIIQCLCKDADLYLLDEPLSGLDQASIEILNKELNKLHNKKKMIIVISHSIFNFKNLNLNVVSLEDSYEI